MTTLAKRLLGGVVTVAFCAAPIITFAAADARPGTRGGSSASVSSGARGGGGASRGGGSASRGGQRSAGAGSAGANRGANATGGGNTTRTASASGNRNVNSNRNTNVNNVNNVNVNRNVNVNGNGNGNWDNDWDDDWEPTGRGLAVVGTAAVVGAIVRQPPANCVPVNVNGVTYSQCGSTWYQPQYSGSQVQYVVVNAPQ